MPGFCPQHIKQSDPNFDSEAEPMFTDTDKNDQIENDTGGRVGNRGMQRDKLEKMHNKHAAINWPIMI